MQEPRAVTHISSVLIQSALCWTPTKSCFETVLQLHKEAKTRAISEQNAQMHQLRTKIPTPRKHTCKLKHCGQRVFSTNVNEPG